MIIKRRHHAAPDQYDSQKQGQHPRPMNEPPLRNENGVLEESHIKAFAPEFKKICSKSSPTPRHSVTRTPCCTSVRSNSSNASSPPTKSNSAPWGTTSTF